MSGCLRHEDYKRCGFQNRSTPSHSNKSAVVCVWFRVDLVPGSLLKYGPVLEQTNTGFQMLTLKIEMIKKKPSHTRLRVYAKDFLIHVCCLLITQSSTRRTTPITFFSCGTHEPTTLVNKEVAVWGNRPTWGWFNSFVSRVFITPRIVQKLNIVIENWS